MKSKILRTRLCLALFSGTMLMGCANSQTADNTPKPIFDEVIVFNKSTSTIRDVKLKDEVTKRYFECSIILPDRQCALGFTARKAQGHAATISWQTETQHYQHSIKSERPVSQAYVGKVHIDILPQGKAFTYLKPSSDQADQRAP